MNREGRGKIGYLDEDWNPVVGCTNGCPWCWARRQAKRQRKNCQVCYDFTPHLHLERLGEPLRKRKPLVIGVAFMGDLFDPTLDEGAPQRRSDAGVVLDVVAGVPRHTFVVLTKQPRIAARVLGGRFEPPFAPMPNLVLGVSVEDQASADRLVPDLLACRAATRIVSIEPMRGPVLLRPAWIRPQRGCDGRHSHPGPHADGSPGQPAHHHHDEFCGPRLSGVILGGQTGSGAVPMDPNWVRAVRDQCAEAGVPFFFKQWGDVVYPEAMTDEVFAEIDAAVNLSGCRQGAFRIGRKRAGRMLDGRTHDGLAWDKNFTLSVKA